MRIVSSALMRDERLLTSRSGSGMRLCSTEFITALTALLTRYGLRPTLLDDDAVIPGSYWGAPEAGLIGANIYLRHDTPLHSALHEAAHVICMDEARRATLHTDAGGEYCEEDAVCYLQIVLAQQLGVSIAGICADMDEWGYSFRLGSALAWFTQDASDARAWLLEHDLITAENTATGRSRSHPRADTAMPDIAAGDPVANIPRNFE